jgi:hypothetical protein
MSNKAGAFSWGMARPFSVAVRSPGGFQTPFFKFRLLG